MNIKGISHSLAIAVPVAAGIDPNIMIGRLTEEQIDHLENVMKNPSQFGILAHAINRRTDPSLGVNRHLIASELSITNRGDIDFMRKIHSYKGNRHELGQPVRGQRTRSSFRKGMQVGVAKGLARQAGKPAAPAGTAPAGAPATPGKPTTAAPVKGATPAPAKKEEKK